MDKIITYNFGENFIEKLSDFLCDEFLKNNNDLSKAACVFGGKRPALFLRRTLFKRIGKSFLPPQIFSIDEFVEYLVFGKKTLGMITELELCFLIYTISKKHIPALLKGRASFSEFLPWAKEIVSFIEHLDLEDIQNQRLSCVQMSALIGYEVPKSINDMLLHIITLRNDYHKALYDRGLLSRGMKYLEASKVIAENSLLEFDRILFCNFFYLHKTEAIIIKDICDKGKGTCIFQGQASDWPVLKNNIHVLESKKEGLNFIEPVCGETKLNNILNALSISFYEGFDMHSESCIALEVLKDKVKNKDNTVIVMPCAESLIPLLTQISSTIGEFNVSMGYPFKRTPLYTLFDALLKCQESKKDGKYYTKDYLALMSHPFVKKINISGEVPTARIMVHKIEELLKGSEKTSIGGNIFLALSAIESEKKIYLNTSQTLNNMNIQVSIGECKAVLKELHALLFCMWEGLSGFKSFSHSLEHLLDALTNMGEFMNFAFNIKAIEKLYLMLDVLRKASFANEIFASEDIWKIFRQMLESELISFVGSPLKGTQVLGLLETRSLSFENVIVLDLNEAVLPKLKIYEPLIPREVMLSLGLNRLEKEEEVQRYQFMRLITSAKNVYLIYEENEEKEKSRFVQELLWARQKQAKKIDVALPQKASFSMKALSMPKNIEKTASMCEFLRKQIYSASRLNTYLSCPVRFFYQYVLGLKEKENLLSEPEAHHIGNFIHELLESAFREFEGRRPLIDSKFRKRFFEKMECKFDEELAPRMRSDSFLLKNIIAKRLDKFLVNESKRNVAKIVCLEERRRETLDFKSLGHMQFEYRVDRIDELEDRSIMVIDYKTGGSDFLPKKLKGLKAMRMNRQSIKENLKSFQLPLYYYFTSRDFSDTQVNAQIYNIRNLERKVFIRDEDLSEKEKINQICLKAFNCILSEIFDPEIAFAADKDERRCKMCPFRLSCS